MTKHNQATFFWYDFETYGVHPAKDRPVQFAGIRTDMDLNIIGEPQMFYCRLTPDYPPSPEAMFVTGITPQIANQRGLTEAEFIARIEREFATPNTCVAGYNSLRFDDEVTRYTLYRNFYDPYAREWQHGNSRWDILDLLRACYALRPEGINWIYKEDGTPSFKLEKLTQANGISHDNAHDAMSDVYATIAMAKLIKDKQPKLFDYYFQLRDKKFAAKQLDVLNMKPVFHVSGMFGSAQGNCSLVVPVTYHATNKNQVICVDLNQDLSPLYELDAPAIRERLYTKREDLAEDELPIAIKNIHLNKCPFITTPKALSEEKAQTFGIDLAFARNQYRTLVQHPEIKEKLSQVFDTEYEGGSQDPDLMLYSGGFFSRSDKAQMEIIRATAPHNLAALNLPFEDQRLPEMFFRYRARNYPETLDEQEQLKWFEFCKNRWDQDYQLNLADLMETTTDPAKQRLLRELVHYIQSL